MGKSFSCSPHIFAASLCFVPWIFRGSNKHEMRLESGLVCVMCTYAHFLFMSVYACIYVYFLERKLNRIRFHSNFQLHIWILENTCSALFTGSIALHSYEIFHHGEPKKPIFFKKLKKLWDKCELISRGIREYITNWILDTQIVHILEGSFEFTFNRKKICRFEELFKI